MSIYSKLPLAVGVEGSLISEDTTTHGALAVVAC